MLTSIAALWDQFFPPQPTFTKDHVRNGSQQGKVFVVTGGNTGIGLALKLLYPTGATIYIAGRTPSKIQAAIAEVIAESKSPGSLGNEANLKALHVDFSDLPTVKQAAAILAAQEFRVDIIWNNAGHGCLPGSVTKQGLEGHVGVNCVAPLLFTQELLPLLQAAAKATPPSSVRIVWSASVQIEFNAPLGGIDYTRIEQPTTNMYEEYAASKAGNWLLAYEAASRWGPKGIISVCQNPGNINTGFYKNISWLLLAFLRVFVLYEPKYGAYTMLFAGLSPEIQEANNGAYIWPWGRIMPPARPDIVRAVAEGKARRFWSWCEEAWQKHV